jgi:hypothetical protein
MLKAPQYGRRRKRMSDPVNYHKENAMTGTPSQQTDKYKGKEPKETDFGEGADGAQSTPHSTESLLGEKG